VAKAPPLTAGCRLKGAPAPALFIPGKLPFLAKPDFKEDQEQASSQPSRDQHDRQDLAHDSGDQGRTRGAGQHQSGGGSKPKDA
jgi:hypothetical protein